MKPRIFIGSSSEGLDVANKVKAHLSDFAECVIWNEDVFSFNQSYFDTLLKIINFYDYGILVATSDDFTESREKAFEAPRDNVIFEFGLFLGRLGKNRVFFLREETSKLPSDLLGISLPSFPEKNGKKKNDAIEKACVRIIKELGYRKDTFDLGILPSLPLAYGYYENFVKHTGEALFKRLGKKIKVTIGDKENEKTMEIVLKDFKLSLLIPDELKGDVKEDVLAAKFERGWEQIRISTDLTGKSRSYSLYVSNDSVINEHLELFDVPTTLNALNMTIGLYIQSGSYGKGHFEQLLERREMAAFKQVIDYEVSRNGRLRKKVITEIVDI